MKLYSGLKIRKLLYRTALITAGFAAAGLILETALVLTWGNARESLKDQTSGWHYFHQIYEPIAVPLMRRTRKDGIITYEFNRKDFSSSYPELSVKAKKGSNEVRIIIIGESVAQSFRINEEIRTIFEARFPEHKVNIINTGAGMYTSSHILSVARDIMRLNPDFVMVLMGNNIYAFAYLSIKKWRILRSRALIRHLYARSWVFRIFIERIYSGNTNGNYGTEHFKQDYNEIARIFTSRDLPFAVFTLPIHYADYPPYSSSYLIEREEQFLPFILYSEGRYEDLLNTTDPAGDTFLWFLKGNALKELGLYEKAREAYLKTVPKNSAMTTPDINKIIREIAERYDTLLVDVYKLFEKLSQTGLTGKDFFYDYCHWYFPYYTVIADTVVRKINEFEISGIPPVKQNRLIPELPQDELMERLKNAKARRPFLKMGIFNSTKRHSSRQSVFYFKNHIRYNTYACISLLLNKHPDEIADWFLHNPWSEHVSPQIEPNWHKVLTSAGEAARRMGDLKLALEFFGESLKRNPEYWETYFLKSLAHLNKGETEEAEKNLNRAAQLCDFSIPVKDILLTASEGYND